MALTEAELQTLLEEAMQNPLETEADDIRTKEQRLKDLIDLDRYLASKRSAAVASNTAGLRFLKIVPPGSV